MFLDPGLVVVDTNLRNFNMFLIPFVNVLRNIHCKFTGCQHYGSCRFACCSPLCFAGAVIKTTPVTSRSRIPGDVGLKICDGFSRRQHAPHLKKAFNWQGVLGKEKVCLGGKNKYMYINIYIYIYIYIYNIYIYIYAYTHRIMLNVSQHGFFSWSALGVYFLRIFDIFKYH